MKYKAICVLALISMCEGDTGSTCEMNSCVDDTTSTVNYTYFLAITVFIFIAIFIFCIYVCFKWCDKDGRNSRRPTAAQLNDGVVDMVPFNMMPHICI